MLVLFGLTTVAPNLAAQFQPDTFSGTTIDGSKWEAPFVTGNGALTQNNGLFYHNKGLGTTDDEANLYSQGVGPVTDDWSVWMDVQIPSLSQINTDGQSVVFTLKIWNSINLSNRFDVEIHVQQYPGYGKFRTIGGDLTTNNWETSESSSVFLDLTAQSVISMAVSWQASTKMFSTLYAPNSGGTNWILLGTWNLGAGSPTAWNLDPAEGFSLYVAGSSHNLNLQTNDNVRITNFDATNAIFNGRVPPTITTGIHESGDDFYPLPGGTLSNAYSQTLTATNGAIPYTWSLVTLGSTGLPPGLNLASNGAITGTPTAEGTWYLRVRVSGANGAYSENNYSITVINPHLLGIASSGTNVILTWPINASGFTLQSSTNLASPAVWITNPPAPVIVNGLNTVTNPIYDARKFYRLIK